MSAAAMLTRKSGTTHCRGYRESSLTCKLRETFNSESSHHHRPDHQCVPVSCLLQLSEMAGTSVYPDAAISERSDICVFRQHTRHLACRSA
jgi:hypothetical protein